MNTWILLLSLALTAALSSAAPPVLRPLLKRRGVYDVANQRSSHSGSVVRGLGSGVWIALTAGWAVALIAGSFGASAAKSDFRADNLAPALLVVAGFTGAALLGLAEDFKGLSVRGRSLAQLLLAATIAVLAVLLAAERLPVWALVLLACFGVLYISSYINVANFMDGLNGLSALQGIIAGLTFAAIGIIEQQPWLQLGGLLLTVAFACFLPYNLKGYGFLGDVGSYLLGGSVITLSFVAICTGAQPLAATGPTIIYFGDVGWTLLKRIKRGANISEAHKEHVYQRVQQAGASHLGASLYVAGLTAVACVLGLLSYAAPHKPLWQLALLAAGLTVVIAYLNLPRLFKQD